MKILVNDQVCLAEFELSDRDAIVSGVNDRDIYDRTLRIPFPYTEADADSWLARTVKITAEQGQRTHWAIRLDTALVGACGFQDFEAGKSHRAEVGYWLAKPFWGRGIMTAVVRRLCRHAFEEMGLVKITAHVFAGNPASARVLEKCGFQQEGFLRRHFQKDGQLLDVRLFGLLR